MQSQINSTLLSVIKKQNEFQNRINNTLQTLSSELEAVKKLVCEPVRRTASSQNTSVYLVSPISNTSPLAAQQQPTVASGAVASSPDSRTSSAEIIRARFEDGRLTLGFEPIISGDIARIAEGNTHIGNQ